MAMGSSRAINPETGFHIRINLYIIRYFWNNIRNKAVWGDGDIYSLLDISRQRFGRIIGGANFFMSPETVADISGKLGIDKKYLTVVKDKDNTTEDKDNTPDDKIIHIDGVTFEDWKIAFSRLITMEANQKRMEGDKVALENPTKKEEEALNKIEGALSEHIADGFISDKYGKSAPLFRIYYYFSKGFTYKEGAYADHLINELSLLNMREWGERNIHELKKYQTILSKHLEYINALLVIGKYKDE